MGKIKSKFVSIKNKISSRKKKIFFITLYGLIIIASLVSLGFGIYKTVSYVSFNKDLVEVQATCVSAKYVEPKEEGKTAYYSNAFTFDYKDENIRRSTRELNELMTVDQVYTIYYNPKTEDIYQNKESALPMIYFYSGFVVLLGIGVFNLTTLKKKNWLQ